LNKLHRLKKQNQVLTIDLSQFQLTRHDFPTPPDPKTHNLYSGIGMTELNML